MDVESYQSYFSYLRKHNLIYLVFFFILLLTNKLLHFAFYDIVY